MLLRSYMTKYHSVLMVFATTTAFLMPGGLDTDVMLHIYVDCSYVVW